MVDEASPEEADPTAGGRASRTAVDPTAAGGRASRTAVDPMADEASPEEADTTAVVLTPAAVSLAADAITAAAEITDTMADTATTGIIIAAACISATGFPMCMDPAITT